MSWGGDSNAGYTPSHQVNNGGLPQTATTSKFNAFIKGYTSWEKDWLLATIAAVVLVPVVLFGAVVGGAEVGIPICNSSNNFPNRWFWWSNTCSSK